ncbi:hypothetical protein PAMA_003881 [Pampus argenteus]
MDKSSVLLVIVLVTCSVWAVRGRSFTVNIDDEEQVDTEISVEAGKLPGVCWACKWALEKVKKAVGSNATVEKIKSKLLNVCNQIGLLKRLCSKFVHRSLSLLIEELTTTDDVRTICVNAKACKSDLSTDVLLSPEEFSDLVSHPDDDETEIKIHVYPRRRMQG